jgi:hypothetical protein
MSKDNNKRFARSDITTVDTLQNTQYKLHCLDRRHQQGNWCNAVFFYADESGIVRKSRQAGGGCDAG